MALSLCYWAKVTEGKTKLRKKSEDAVASDHILKWGYDAEYKHITAVVQASMKDTSYNVDIDLGEDYSISNGHCQCPMGNYECHHIAAALLYGYKRASKTDVKCSWLRHPKSKIPRPTVDMSHLYPSRKPNYRALDRPVEDEDRSYMYDELCRLGRFTGMEWVLLPEPAVQTSTAPIISDLLVSSGFLQSQCKTTWLSAAVSMSPEAIAVVAAETAGQKVNPLWAAVRSLRLTASNFGLVLKAQQRQSYPASLWKRLLSCDNLDSVRSIAWGRNHEAVAIDQYCAYGAAVEGTGIWLHESGILGASPDGIVSVAPQAHCPISLQTQEAAAMVPDIIEVKCPYASRDLTVAAASESIKGFAVVSGPQGFTLSCQHDYYDQVQGQLHVMNKNCCDFIIWTTVDMQVVRIPRDSTWSHNMAKLTEFYFTSYITHVLSK